MVHKCFHIVFNAGVQMVMFFVSNVLAHKPHVPIQFKVNAVWNAQDATITARNMEMVNASPICLISAKSVSVGMVISVVSLLTVPVRDHALILFLCLVNAALFVARIALFLANL